MKPTLPLLTLLLAVMGCKDVKQTEKPVVQPSSVHDSLPPAAPSAKAHEEDVWPVVHQFYVDSTRIGIKGKNKIEMKCISEEDTMYTDIRLYAKVNQKWIQKQQLRWHFSLVTIRPPEYTDFNNDGCCDFIYTSESAARGANEVQTLFMFDKATGLLRLIKNSEEYPNLHYNRKLKCIDSWALHGGSTSSFLSIDADSLHLFGSVTVLHGQLYAYRYDKNGKQTLIKQQAFEDDFPRFKNFDPLEEYTEKDYK